MDKGEIKVIIQLDSQVRKRKSRQLAEEREGSFTGIHLILEKGTAKVRCFQRIRRDALRLW